MFTRTAKVLIATTGLVFACLPAFAADNRDVVTDSRGYVLVNTYGNCVRTHWQAEGDVCSKPVAQQVETKRIAQRRLQQEERTVYFEFNKSTLTGDATTRLDTLATVLTSDEDVKNVRIIGFADRIGSKAYNERLSQRRAQSVQDYLTRRGLINSSIAKTRWLGEDAPVTQCPDSLSRAELITCLQRDRRVEVEVDYVK